MTTTVTRRWHPTAHTIEDVEWCIRWGDTHSEAVAHRLGYASPGALIYVLRRAGRQDLVNVLLAWKHLT